MVLYEFLGWRRNRKYHIFLIEPNKKFKKEKQKYFVKSDDDICYYLGWEIRDNLEQLISSIINYLLNSSYKDFIIFGIHLRTKEYFIIVYKNGKQIKTDNINAGKIIMNCVEKLIKNLNGLTIERYKIRG